jgi:hypothetical protein
MHPLLKMLEGGDRRSIGRSNEAVARVLAAPGLIGVLFDGMGSDDPLLAMRCADAAEKVTALRPDLLQARKAALLGPLAQIEQKEVRWHVAPMLARLPLSQTELERAVDILLAWTNERSSIVKALAMQALADLALRNEKLRPAVLQHIRELVVIGTPAMQARGRKLIGLLDPHKAATRSRRDSPRAAHNPSVSQ